MRAKDLAAAKPGGTEELDRKKESIRGLGYVKLKIK